MSLNSAATPFSQKNTKNIISELKIDQELATISGMSGVKLRNGELILLAQMRWCPHQKTLTRWLPGPEQEETAGMLRRVFTCPEWIINKLGMAIRALEVQMQTPGCHSRHPCPFFPLQGDTYKEKTGSDAD